MPHLEIEQICRRFAAVQALDAVSLELRSGEVHALMGENGAGKSTLIRVLAGLDRPDLGEIRLDGTKLPNGSPTAIRLAGLRFIHQELHAVHGLSVAENMYLEHPYPKCGGLVKWSALYRAATDALERLGLNRINPRAPMSELGAGDQMLVRIAATLIDSGGQPAWLYVMDEPTAALTNEEAERLFSVIDELCQQGAGVLYVSHRMPEVLRLADRISVLRDGRLVSSRARSETDQDRIIEEMTGRDLSHLFPEGRAVTNSLPPVLNVANLAAGALKSASFALHGGEVLGIAGVSGSGRGALLRALMGDTPKRGGQVELAGKNLTGGVRKAWANGMAYVPRERRSEGLMLRRSITENMTLPHLSNMARGAVFIDPNRQMRAAIALAEQVHLKAEAVDQFCEELSGGNQQKVLFARAAAGRPRVLLLDEPTRGVDIGARYEIYQLIRQLSVEGLAVIIASSDLPELIGLSDRIGIMRDGHLAEIVRGGDLTEADLLAHFYHLPDEGNPK